MIGVIRPRAVHGAIWRWRTDVLVAALVGSIPMLQSGAIASPPVLSDATYSAGQFHFQISGESNAAYIVESSTNLQSWRPVVTNTDSGETRAILVSALNDRSYYRAFVATPVFAFALAAKDYINLDGNNLTTDSFDSADPSFSTDGNYDPLKALAEGNIGAYLGLTNSLDIGNASIWGRIYTGAGGPTAIGLYGSVGDHLWHEADATGIEPGYASTNFSATFRDVTRPFAGGFALSGGTFGGTNYDYVLTTANYFVNNLNLSGTKKMLVVGNSSLYVSSNLTVSGNAYIAIGSGSSLRLYMAGPTASLGGGGIINSQNATNFCYFGMSNNVSLNVTSNFVGCIYAPNAAVSISSAATGTPTDFTGSCIAKSVTLNGPVRVHFDENFRRVSPLH